jgi:uncharacterized protein (TIGR04255 family)
MSEHIHKFLRPPIKETVLGIQFQPLPKLMNAHLGAYWSTVAGQWPQLSEQPPIDPQFEKFDEAGRWQSLGQIQLALMTMPAIRLQMRNQSADRMIQIQNGRFHYNWLRTVNAGDNYPHYGQIREGFEHNLRQFRDYLQAANIGAIVPNQWEVTYVNHITQGTVWTHPDDWSGLFRGLPMPEARFSDVALESFAGEWHFVIPEKRGRLHVQLKHALVDKKQVLVLTLTARGPFSDNMPPILDGLNLGREVIVCAFKNLTSDDAHKFWGICA